MAILEGYTIGPATPLAVQSPSPPPPVPKQSSPPVTSPPPAPSPQAPSASQIIAEIKGVPVSAPAAKSQAEQDAAAAAVAAAVEAKGAPLTVAEASAAADAGAASVQPGTGLTAKGQAAAEAAGVAAIDSSLRSLDTLQTKTTFTHADLESLWLLAGGLVQYADTAAAIAQAESNGCRYAHAGPNDDRPKKTCTYRETTGEDSYGLWQINRDAHPQYTAATLYTALGNAAAAVDIANGGVNFKPWTTYKTGAYKDFLVSGKLPTGSQGAAASSVSLGPNAAWGSIIGFYQNTVRLRHNETGALVSDIKGVFT